MKIRPAVPADAVAVAAIYRPEAIGIYRHVGYKHGAWRDVGWWQKRLRPLDAPGEPRPFQP